MLQVIETDQAPSAIGTYSQAIKAGNTVYISGQIPLDPKTQAMVQGDFAAHVHQAFANLQAIVKASGGDLKNIVKLNIYLLDLQNFATVNSVMAEFFDEPYPARAVLGVQQLPKNAVIEMDAVVVL